MCLKLNHVSSFLVYWKGPVPHDCPYDHRQICQDSAWSAKSLKMPTLHLQTDSSRDLFFLPTSFFPLFLWIEFSSQFVQHCSSGHMNYSLCNKEQRRHLTPKLPHNPLFPNNFFSFILWKIDIDFHKIKIKSV